MSWYTTWDETGSRLIETGTKQGMVYPYAASGNPGNGVGWDGLREVNNQHSGAEETKLWADDIKYMSLRSAEEFGVTIGAYMSPDEFDICDGSARPTGAVGLRVGQQTRRPFDFSYVSTLASDTLGYEYGYEIHLLYNLTASPTEMQHSSINDSPEGAELSWECTSVPVNMTGYKPTSELVVTVVDDGTQTSLITRDPATGVITKSDRLQLLENMIYGEAATTGDNPTPAILPIMPRPDVVKGILDGTITTRPAAG